LHWGLILEIGFLRTFLEDLAVLLNAVYLHIVEVVKAEDNGPWTPVAYSPFSSRVDAALIAKSDSRRSVVVAFGYLPLMMGCE
jgi:hypothetical protein